MKSLDIKNMKFGELVPIEVEIKNGKRGWRCKCSCGEYKWFPTFQITSGNSKTCGAAIHRIQLKVGERIGKLVINKIIRNDNTRRYSAECICDCGNIKTVSFKNLQRNSAISCGCYRKRPNKGLPTGVSCRNALLSSYKSNAKKKGHEFSLSEEYCYSLFEGNCYLCGSPPKNIFKKGKLKGEFIYNGIDRIDSSKGYLLDNVMSCCSYCNFLKGAIHTKDFLEHIKKIYNYRVDIERFEI